MKREIEERENRSPNLADVLQRYGGAKHDIIFRRENDSISYSLTAVGQNTVLKTPVYTDALSRSDYFFTNLPIEYLFHDDVINPRSIGQNITKLIDEFYVGNPQLHIALAWAEIEDGVKTKIKIFDGQHKAAAQILLGTKNLPVRVFINPNRDRLTLTNFNAGTNLRQVAFDKSVQRHLGNTIYVERVERYQKEHGLSADNFEFSEKSLVGYFKGESREMKRYILDSIRDNIIHNQENKLKDYIDFGGRAREKPISYSSVEKTFYSFFIFQDVLETNLSHRFEEDKNPRQLEIRQIIKLMNLIAETILIDKFDFEIGTNQIESKIAKGERLPLEHLRAYRMTKEEILWNWLRFTKQIISQYFITNGISPNEEKLFQTEFPEPLWRNLTIFLRNLANLPLWVNYEFANTIFGGKQNYSFWQETFNTGKTSSGVPVLAEPINLIKLIQE